MTVADPTETRPTRSGVYFFGILLVVCSWYAWLAYQLPTSTKSSVIGPGFFPRYIGVIACVLCAIALVRELLAVRGHGSSSADPDEGIGGPFWGDFWAVIAMSFLVLGFFFEILGALLATIVFTYLVMSVINRGRRLANATTAVVLAVVLYLLFEVLLNSGMPAGVLPL